MSDPRDRQLLDQVSVLEMKVRRETASAARAGPFAGMIIPDETSWHGGNVLQKLLGVYELELASAIAAAVSFQPEVVLKIHRKPKVDPCRSAINAVVITSLFVATKPTNEQYRFGAFMRRGGRVLGHLSAPVALPDIFKGVSGPFLGECADNWHPDFHYRFVKAP